LKHIAAGESGVRANGCRAIRTRSIEHYTRISQSHFRYLGAQADVGTGYNRRQRMIHAGLRWRAPLTSSTFRAAIRLYSAHLGWLALLGSGVRSVDCGAAIAGSSAGAIMLAQPSP